MKRDPLAWAALAAALAVTASAEYALARAAGFGEWTAAALPAALDVYAVRALRARRDVAAAVAAVIATNAAAHLVAAGLLPVDWPLVVAVSAIAPLVLWRVHRLADHAEATREQPLVPLVNEHRATCGRGRRRRGHRHLRQGDRSTERPGNRRTATRRTLRRDRAAGITAGDLR